MFHKVVLSGSVFWGGATVVVKRKEYGVVFLNDVLIIGQTERQAAACCLIMTGKQAFDAFHKAFAFGITAVLSHGCAARSQHIVANDGALQAVGRTETERRRFYQPLVVAVVKAFFELATAVRVDVMVRGEMVAHMKIFLYELLHMAHAVLIASATWP